MHKLVIAILCFSCILNLCACSPANSTSTPPSTSTTPDIADAPLPTDGHYNILFIGNSHTFYNSMPEQIFSQIAKSAGYDHVSVKSVTVGGATLSGLYNNASVISEIATGEYDYIVLQEQLARPILNPGLFLESSRQFCLRIQAANPEAQVILYQVWGGAPGNIKLNETGCSTTDEINYRLAAANLQVAQWLTQETLTAKAALSGLAFLEIEKADPSVSLYANDGYHPSYVGSYLSALTIFTTIFRADPKQVNWYGSTGQVSETLAAAMQAAVESVVFHTPEIDADYYPSF